MSRVAFRPWATCLIAALLATVAHGTAAAVPPAAWELVSDAHGMRVERRATETALYEFRVTAESSLTPAAIFETIWAQREHPQFVPHLKRLELLSETSDERLVYEQLNMPLVRDRDYTVRLRRRVDLESQRYEVAFVTANEAGPLPDKNHIRVPTIRGRWLIEPGPDGKGATVRYEVFGDPGGVLPAWLLNRVQSESVVQLVRAMLQRTREKASRK
jgi:Polyketide cyclase / dehydrase and lipid transport